MALSREDYNRMVGLIASGDLPESKLAAAKRAINEYETANNVEDTALEAVNTIAQNITAGVLGLPGDIAALIGKENKYTSEEIAVRLGGDPEHGSFLPTQLLSPGPGELKLLAGFGTVATPAAVRLAKASPGEAEKYAKSFALGRAGADSRFADMVPKLRHGDQEVNLYKIATKQLNKNVFELDDGRKAFDDVELDIIVDEMVKSIALKENPLRGYDPEQGALSTYIFATMRNEAITQQDKLLREKVPLTGRSSRSMGPEELRRIRIEVLQNPSADEALTPSGRIDSDDAVEYLDEDAMVLAGEDTESLGELAEDLGTEDPTDAFTPLDSDYAKRAGSPEERALLAEYPEPTPDMRPYRKKLVKEAKANAKGAFRAFYPPLGNSGSTRVRSAEDIYPPNTNLDPVSVRPQIIKLVSESVSTRTDPKMKAALVDALTHQALGGDIKWTAIIKARFGEKIPLNRRQNLATNLKRMARPYLDDADQIAKIAEDRNLREVRGKYIGDVAQGTQRSTADLARSGSFDRPMEQPKVTGKPAVPAGENIIPAPVISRQQSRLNKTQARRDIAALTMEIKALSEKLRRMPEDERPMSRVRLLYQMQEKRRRLRNFIKDK